MLENFPNIAFEIELGRRCSLEGSGLLKDQAYYRII